MAKVKTLTASGHGLDVHIDTDGVRIHVIYEHDQGDMEMTIGVEGMEQLIALWRQQHPAPDAQPRS